MGGTYDPDEESHFALHAIRGALERHPMIEVAQGFPDGHFKEIRATLSPNYASREFDSATLTVRWFSGASEKDWPEFSFHYVEEGSEIGVHHHPNSHVDGWGHIQTKHSDEADYDYNEYSFDSLEPERVTWEALSYVNTWLE